MSNPQILVHRVDTSVDNELRQAVTALSRWNPVLHFGSELRSTIAAANDFQPAVAMLEIGEDFETLRTLIEELQLIVPDISFVGMYNADRLPTGMNESTTMMRALRLGVEDFLRRPIANADLAQVLDQRLAPRRKQRANSGQLVTFVSNKGGVGKSTSAVNLAVELASRYPQRVALIDGSLQMGVCATQLNMRPDATLVDAWQQRDRLDQQLLSQLMTVHESGLHLLAAPLNAIEAAEIDDAFLSRILLMARRTYDYVVVDTFPLFDRTIMAILDLCDIAFVVVENVVPTLQTVRGFFDLLAEVEFPEQRQRVLLNRYSTRAGGPSTDEVSRYLGRDADYVIPFDRKVVLAANTGKPFIMNPVRWGKASASIRMMADDIESMAEAASQPNQNNSQQRQADPSQSNPHFAVEPSRLATDGGGDSL